MAAGTHPVTVNPGGGEISPDGNTRSFTINSTISGGGAVIKNSINPATANEYANVLTLGGTNTYTGGTIIRRGRLVVASDANLGAASGVLTIDNAQFGVTGSFSSARTVVLANTNGLTGTFAGSSVDVPGSSTLEFSGPVIGNNSLSKTGTGTLILSAAGGNGYLGTTSVLAGTLLVNNGGLTGTGGGTVTVLGGATLGGTGSIGSDVVMTGASTLAPGASPGTLDIARSLTLSATGTLAVELAGTTPGDTAGSYDQVNVQQSATLAGGLSASLLNGFEPSASDVFYILSRDSGTGTFNGLAEGGLVNLGGGVTAQITYQANWSGLQATSTLTGGNDVALYNVVIPEPASLSVVGLAAAGLLARRRRRA
jgi:autotransporter-associated beta strand protein